VRTISPLLILLALGCRPRADEPTSPPPSSTPAPALPQVGARAPDFVLRSIDGETVALADALAQGPVVLVFGSFT
jgi:hypothetical protein